MEENSFPLINNMIAIFEDEGETCYIFLDLIKALKYNENSLF